MKKIIYSVLLLCNILFAVTEEETSKITHVKTPIEEAIPYFETIKDIEITIGTGPDNIYVFVDPMCPHSRNFITLIHGSPNMQKNYTYHIWLYRLPKFDSVPLIYTIYNKNKEERLNLLYDIMVNGKKVKPISNVSNDNLINYKRIEIVALKLDIYKRPYLFVSKKGK